MKLTKLLPIDKGSPQFAEETQFDFDNPKRNKKYYEKRLLEISKVILDTPNTFIFVSGSRRNGAVIGYDKEEQFMFFVSEYHVEVPSSVGANVTQVAVWKSRNFKYKNSSIVRDTIFDVFLTQYRNMLTDRLQTDRGMLLWRSLLEEASKRGFYVYLVNTKKKVIYSPRLDESVEKFWDRTNHVAYGYTNKNQRYRYMISRDKW